MAKKKWLLLNILTLVSFILLCGTIFLFHISYKTKMWPHEKSLSLRNDFHIGVRGGRCRSYLVFFNIKGFPDTGSIVGSKAEITGFSVLGIVYSHIAYPYDWDGTPYDQTQWTLYISLWYPVVLFSILPVMFLYRKRRNYYKRLQEAKPEQKE